MTEQKDMNLYGRVLGCLISEICAWRKRFTHVLLVYAHVGKIMDMWLTSITKFFRWWEQHAEIPMGLVRLVVAICHHHLPHRI
jgi:hypothetical protein